MLASIREPVSEQSQIQRAAEKVYGLRSGSERVPWLDLEKHSAGIQRSSGHIEREHDAGASVWHAVDDTEH